MILLAKLLLAHLVGDFILQRDSHPRIKSRKLWRSRWLFVHAIVHTVLAGMALYDTGMMSYAIAIGMSHFFGDWLRESFNEEYPVLSFTADQVFHLAVLALVWFQVSPSTDLFVMVWKDVPWITLTGLAFITTPTSRIINSFLSMWPPTKSVEKMQGLSNAGQWIGIIERILVFTFLMAGHWEAIGFLMAAKSIFRFGDLKENREIHLTEYILIGTLLSFSLAIFTAMLVGYLTTHT